MAEATLDSPLTLDPQQATKLVIRGVQIDLDGRDMTIHFDLVGAGNVILARRSVVATGSQVQTYISNQETNYYTRLLAKLGITGTIG